MKRFSTCRWVAMLGWVLGSSSPVFAQPAQSDAEEARRLYERAAQAYSEKRNFLAIELFKKAAELAPSASFSYNIGLAYEDAGDTRNALRYFRDYLRRAPEAPDRAEVTSRITRLEKKMEELGLQQLTVQSDPKGSWLMIDTLPMGVTPATVELHPGRHEILVQQQGYKDAAVVIEVPKERSIEVTLAQQKASGAAPASLVISGQSQGNSPPEAEHPSGLARIQPVSWALLGVGTGSLLGSVVFEIARAKAVDDRDQATRPEQIRDSERRAIARQSASLTLLGLGVATLTTGGVLAFLDYTRKEPPPRAPAQSGFGLGCSSSECAMSYRGQF